MPAMPRYAMRKIGRCRPNWTGRLALWLWRGNTSKDNAAILTAPLLGTNHYDFRGVATNLGITGKFDTLSAPWPI
jgi:hypothetical protein